MNDTAAAAPFGFDVWMLVNETLQGYADALDRADMPALLSHFDENARWLYSPSVMVSGHEAIRAFFAERLGVFARTSHNVGPPVLRPGSQPGWVQSTAYVHAEHLLVDGSRYRVFARYIDQLRLTPTRALICERMVKAHVAEGTDRSYTYAKREMGPLASPP